jgi:hypothetical protein
MAFVAPSSAAVVEVASTTIHRPSLSSPFVVVSRQCPNGRSGTTHLTAAAAAAAAAVSGSVAAGTNILLSSVLGKLFEEKKMGGTGVGVGRVVTLLVAAIVSNFQGYHLSLHDGGHYLSCPPITSFMTYAGPSSCHPLWSLPSTHRRYRRGLYPITSLRMASYRRHRLQ